MKMKKILSLLVVSSMIVTCLTACGKATTPEVSETSQPKVEVPVASQETPSEVVSEVVEPESETPEKSLAYNPEDNYSYFGTDPQAFYTVFTPLNSWTNTWFIGLKSPYMDYNKNDRIYNLANESNIIPKIEEYKRTITAEEPFTNNSEYNWDIVGWVPSGQSAELTSYDENFPVFSAKTGDISIFLYTDQNLENIPEVPSDVCFIVEHYGTEPATLSDIFAESDYDDLDQLINDEVNGIIHSTDIRKYSNWNHIIFSEYDIFDGPGDYAIRAYAKRNDNGEWHSFGRPINYVAVRDMVAEGIVNNY